MSESYRIKSGSYKTGFFPYYFKITTDEYQTEIYFVKFNKKASEIKSMEIYFGGPLSKEEVEEFVQNWINDLTSQQFKIIK